MIDLHGIHSFAISEHGDIPQRGLSGTFACQGRLLNMGLGRKTFISDDCIASQSAPCLHEYEKEVDSTWHPISLINFYAIRESPFDIIS
jgi:hypothetical protein